MDLIKASKKYSICCTINKVNGNNKKKVKDAVCFPKVVSIDVWSRRSTAQGYIHINPYKFADILDFLLTSTLHYCPKKIELFKNSLPSG